MKETPPDYFHPAMSDFDAIWLPFTENGRVIIDRKTFQEENYISHVAVGNVKVPDLKLCPPFAYGYSLSRKEWSRFYVQILEPVPWKQNSFDSLVMKENQKALLRALVTSHTFPENARDQMQQKSKGLVVLLHGSPGSGKTLTAECSAEITKRPLFTASIAELNKYDRPWYFEYQLQKVLQFATIWKAVILLDEADVFLEARTDEGNDAVARNALVAVFLRHLEYFSGIVFLTTNRIHVFDPAMKSRIHLALGYSPPGNSMRRSMWVNSLKQLPPDDVDIDFNNSNETVESIVQEKLNGREITNTINTARTLARYENKPLRLHHIETVLGIRTEFDQTLKRMAIEAADPQRVGSIGPVRQGSLLASMNITNDPEEI
ncbi:P-loop containing nucleoside triphosphate hydrolase protein [Talaromyces proteolyticus]|uniref:P-loop containing nucleoside triphosphate hydrolase protein n=1 Tax=Talaromyces proteolyticus TaxID=1131652 RepID=A0AAD4L2T1_9EURO|nr:P-loop containing nucleoside triphosphate hydrolase protein [Talaromyces proteolyticus]KAH8703539.1 P-loop containing nucleoside triphosphate hydrolase protein [Talaromyces proteolyticus]